MCGFAATPVQIGFADESEAVEQDGRTPDPGQVRTVGSWSLAHPRASLVTEFRSFFASPGCDHG